MVSPLDLLYANNHCLLFAGSRFSIVMNFTSVNGTGTGMYVVLIDTVDGIPLYTNSLTEPQPPGTYAVKWDAEASLDPDCEVFCEQWLPGNYTVHAGMHCLLP